MQSSLRLSLIRHGQTAWNVEGRAQGHCDIPLDETGRDQVCRLGVAYGGLFDRVFSSDLRRAAETAQVLACHDTTLDPALRERSFGEWEGLPFRDFYAQMPADRSQEFHFRPPGGESFQDVWERLQDWTCQLTQAEGRVAVVSHGGTCALLMAILLRGTPETSRSFRLGNTAVTEFERRSDGRFTLLRYNCTRHLEAEPRAGGTDGS